MAVVGKNPISEGDFHGFLPVTGKELNSYSKSFTPVDRTKAKTQEVTQTESVLTSCITDVIMKIHR